MKTLKNLVMYFIAWALLTVPTFALDTFEGMITFSRTLTMKSAVELLVPDYNVVCPSRVHPRGIRHTVDTSYYIEGFFRRGKGEFVLREVWPTKTIEEGRLKASGKVKEISPTPDPVTPPITPPLAEQPKPLPPVTPPIAAAPAPVIDSPASEISENVIDMFTSFSAPPPTASFETVFAQTTFPSTTTTIGSFENFNFTEPVDEGVALDGKIVFEDNIDLSKTIKGDGPVIQNSQPGNAFSTTDTQPAKPSPQEGPMIFPSKNDRRSIAESNAAKIDAVSSTTSEETGAAVVKKHLTADQFVMIIVGCVALAAYLLYLLWHKRVWRKIFSKDELGIGVESKLPTVNTFPIAAPAPSPGKTILPPEKKPLPERKPVDAQASHSREHLLSTFGVQVDDES
ncbi:MAG: hypothetical protein V4576_00740 [Patescibacteria group bacterium]